MALTIAFVLRDFAEWTSIPGPIQIIYALNSFIRFLWVIIWCALFGVFVYEFYLIIDKVIKLDSQIDISFDFQSMRFPIVTFCNQNPYKFKVVNTNAEFIEISNLMANYKRVVTSGYQQISDDRYAFNNATSRYQKEIWAEESLRLLANALSTQSISKMIYTFEDLVQSCHFNNVQCTRLNFTEFLDSTYGSCFQFNPPNIFDFQSLRAGSPFGLRLMLNVMQNEPQGDRQYLPTTKLAGIRMSINFENKNPFMNSFGMNFPVGRDSQVSMKLLKTKLMPPPYGLCVESASSSVYNFYINNTYTLQNCLRSCRQKLTINTCGCADPRYKNFENVAPFCGLKNISCLIDLKFQPRTNYSFDALRDCGCRPPCNEFYVETQISSSTFPPVSTFNQPQINEFLPPDTLTNYASAGFNVRKNFQNINSINPALFVPNDINTFPQKIINENTILSYNTPIPMFKYWAKSNNFMNFSPHLTFPVTNNFESNKLFSFAAPSNKNIITNQKLRQHIQQPMFQDYSCHGNDILAVFTGDKERCKKWFTDNTLMLNIWFNNLNLECRTQKSSYSISQASNDLGGQVSLWLGASVISVIEIITLIFMIIIFFIYGRNVRVIPTKEEYNKDHRFRKIQELKSELDVHERMDQEFLSRIERQKQSVKKRRAEFNVKLNEAHKMWKHAAEKLKTYTDTLTSLPDSLQMRGKLANAQALERATALYLQQLQHDCSLKFDS